VLLDLDAGRPRLHCRGGWIAEIDGITDPGRLSRPGLPVTGAGWSRTVRPLVPVTSPLDVGRTGYRLGSELAVPTHGEGNEDQQDARAATRGSSVIAWWEWCWSTRTSPILGWLRSLAVKRKATCSPA
jgi:hypothetical protein